MNALVETTNPHVVNGINVDALTALRARVQQDAAQGQTTWRVTTTWQGQTRSRADVSSFAIGDTSWSNAGSSLFKDDACDCGA